MYLPPKVKPLCPPEQPPRFADVVYAQVTLDDGRPYDLKLDVYQSPEQQKTGPCIAYYRRGRIWQQWSHSARITRGWKGKWEEIWNSLCGMRLPH